MAIATNKDFLKLVLNYAIMAIKETKEAESNEGAAAIEANAMLLHCLKYEGIETPFEGERQISEGKENKHLKEWAIKNGAFLNDRGETIINGGRFLTIKDVAEKAGLSYSRVSSLVSEWNLQRVKIGRYSFYNVEDVKTILENENLHNSK